MAGASALALACTGALGQQRTPQGTVILDEVVGATRTYTLSASFDF
ncbi:hypothetical protein [Aureimonas mangrovi]|nr:hypothetical protein [Aureimonas mangrovi]